MSTSGAPFNSAISCDITHALPLTATPRYEYTNQRIPEAQERCYVKPESDGDILVTGFDEENVRGIDDMEATLIPDTIPVLTRQFNREHIAPMPYVTSHPATIEPQKPLLNQNNFQFNSMIHHGSFPVPLLSQHSKFYNQTVYQPRMQCRDATIDLTVPLHSQTPTQSLVPADTNPYATFTPNDSAIYQSSMYPMNHPATFQTTTLYDMNKGATIEGPPCEMPQSATSQTTTQYGATFQNYSPLGMSHQTQSLSPDFQCELKPQLKVHKYLPPNAVPHVHHMNSPQKMSREPLYTQSMPLVPFSLSPNLIPPFHPYMNDTRNFIGYQPLSHRFNPIMPHQYATLPHPERDRNGSLLYPDPQPSMRPEFVASQLFFPQTDTDRLSPGISKTLMAPSKRQYYVHGSEFKFPFNPASEISSVRDKPVSEPLFAQTLCHPEIQGATRVSPPCQYENGIMYEPKSIPPPLPPRAKSSNEAKHRPPMFNPYFLETPIEIPSVPLVPLEPNLPPPYNPSYLHANKECCITEPLLTKCIYCEKDIDSGLMELHINEECPCNPDTVDTSDTLSATSDDTELIFCNICNQEIDVDSLVAHLEVCQTIGSLDTLASEICETTSNYFEGRATMATTSDLESLEVEDQICRRCDKKFTMTGLKRHAEECFRAHDSDVEIIDVHMPSLPPNHEPATMPSLRPERYSETSVEPFVFVAQHRDTIEPPLPEISYLWEKSPPRITPSEVIEPMDVAVKPVPSFTSGTPLFFPQIQEMNNCPVCGKEFKVEELPTHFEECRDNEKGKCPHCKKFFLITILPDHTEQCKSVKFAPLVPPGPAPTFPTGPAPTSEPKPKPYKRCVRCFQEFTSSEHTCNPVPGMKDNICGVCFLEINPVDMETHRIQCLRNQQSEYTELNRKNWIRCLSCLVDILPDDFNQHIKTCDDMLLGDISRYKKFTPNLEDIDWATAALTKEQRSAMDYVVKNAKKLSDTAANVLSQRIIKLGFAKCDLEKTLEWVNFEAPIIIHFFVDKLLPILIAETNYKNQFETGTSHGSKDLVARSRWEDNIFNNIYRNAKGADRVKYGVLNIVGDICGVKNCKQYGDSYFILKRVRLRTSFASADSSNSTVKIASCEHYMHVLNEYTDAELTAILNVATKKKPWANSDVIQQYKEVQIHGPIELSEHIECVVVNQRHKGDRHILELLDNFITKNKCNMIWME